MEETKNWGGHRTGSGRKKNDSLGNKKYVYFEIDDETNGKLEKLYKAMKLYHGNSLTRKKIFEMMVDDSLSDYEMELEERNEEFQNDVKKIANEYSSILFESFYILNKRNLLNGLDPFVVFYGVGNSEQKNKLLKSVQVEANKISVSSFIKENLYEYDSYTFNEISEIKRILFCIRHKFDEVFDLIKQSKFTDEWRADYVNYVEKVSHSSLYE